MKNTKAFEYAVLVALALICQVLVVLDPARGGAGGPLWAVLSSKGRALLAFCLLCAGLWFWLRWRAERQQAAPVLAGLAALSVYAAVSAAMTASVASRFGGEAFLAGHFLKSLNEKLPTLLAAGVAAAVWEEAVFRGLLQARLQRSFNAPVAILVTALAFVLLHIHGDFSLWIFAISLGIVFHMTGSLLAGVLSHLMYNVMSALSQSAADLSSYADHEKLAVAMLHISCMINIPLSLFVNALGYKAMQRWQRRGRGA